jgi:hypothetical protein
MPTDLGKLMKRLLAMSLLAVAPLMLFGCSGESSDPDGEAQAQREAIHRAFGSALTTAGEKASKVVGEGRWNLCGLETQGVEYVASATVTPSAGTTPAATVTAIAEALSNDGWTASKQKSEPPWAQLEQDDLLLTVQVEKLTPEVVTMSIRGECVTGPDGWATSMSEEPEPIEPS